MTWSLRLENGDLVRGPGNSIDTVTGSDKVVQDLMCWIQEPYGTDPLNPELGSFIDIGQEGALLYADGTINYSNNSYPEMVISELKRIINTYQIRQTTRLRVELQKFNGSYTFANDELIERYNIFYERYYDTMFITIDLEMVNGELFRLNIPVEAPSNNISQGAVY